MTVGPQFFALAFEGSTSFVYAFLCCFIFVCARGRLPKVTRTAVCTTLATRDNLARRPPPYLDDRELRRTLLGFPALGSHVLEGKTRERPIFFGSGVEPGRLRLVFAKDGGEEEDDHGGRGERPTGPLCPCSFSSTCLVLHRRDRFSSLGGRRRKSTAFSLFPRDGVWSFPGAVGQSRTEPA